MRGVSLLRPAHDSNLFQEGREILRFQVKYSRERQAQFDEDPYCNLIDGEYYALSTCVVSNDSPR